MTYLPQTFLPLGYYKDTVEHNTVLLLIFLETPLKETFQRLTTKQKTTVQLYEGREEGSKQTDQSGFIPFSHSGKWV